MDEKKSFNLDDAFWRQPGFKFPTHGDISRLDDGQIKEITVETCILPNLNLGEQCHECGYYKNCSFERKRLPKELKKKKND